MIKSQLFPDQCLTYNIPPSPNTSWISIDLTHTGAVFEGVGGLAAVGGARLLYDYPEPLRQSLINLTFSPTNGAAFQLLKTEIMGDIDSSYGSGPAYQHWSTEAPDFNRSIYLQWLIPAAQLARPDIPLYALSWGAPEFVGDLLSSESLDFHLRYLEGARTQKNISFNTIGIWNEAEWSMDYVINLRRALDQAGFQFMSISVPDGDGKGCRDCGPDSPTIFAAIEHNDSFASAVDIVGIHNGGFTTSQPSLPSHIRLWNSENNIIDGPIPQWNPAPGDSIGSGLAWPLSFLQNLVYANATCTILCPLTHSFSWNYGRENHGHSFFLEPWSGHYVLSSPYFTQAHVTQFTRIGWKVVTGNATGSIGQDVTYATLFSPQSLDWSFIAINTNPTLPQKFRLLPPKNSSTPNYFTTAISNSSTYFHLSTLSSLESDIDLPPRSIVTISSLPSANFTLPSNPRRTPFPIPYVSNFASQKHGEPGKFMTDLYGAFTIKDGRLWQGSVAQGSAFHGRIGLPLTALPYGSNLANVNASVVIETNGTARLCVRIPIFSPTQTATLDYSLGICLSLNLQSSSFNLTEATGFRTKSLASNTVKLPPQKTHELRLIASDDCVQASINSVLVASVCNVSLLSGVVAVGSDYNLAYFDELQVYPSSAETPLISPQNLIYDLCPGNTIHNTSLPPFAGIIIVPLVPLTLTKLGRFKAPQNSQSHTLQVFDPTTSQFLLNSPPNISFSSCIPNILNICHAPLSQPLPLLPQNIYYFLATESSDALVELTNPAANTNHENRDGSTLLFHNQDIQVLGRVWGSPEKWETFLEVDSSFGPIDATFE